MDSQNQTKFSSAQSLTKVLWWLVNLLNKGLKHYRKACLLLIEGFVFAEKGTNTNTVQTSERQEWVEALVEVLNS